YQARHHPDRNGWHDQGQDAQDVDRRPQAGPADGSMHQVRKAQTEEKFDWKHDRRVDAGGADRLIEQRVAECARIVSKPDQGPVSVSDRLPDDKDERNGHDHEDRAQGGQENQVRLTLLPAETALADLHDRPGIGGRKIGDDRVTSSIKRGSPPASWSSESAWRQRSARPWAISARPPPG